MPTARYVLIAVALNAALTLLDDVRRFSDGLACISSGSTLLRAASKSGGVPVVPHGTVSGRTGEATRAHRKFNSREFLQTMISLSKRL
jgi:hypothetical protein